MRSERDGGLHHANNFDFIRWLAATMVVASHEFAILGLGDREPLAHLTTGFTTFGTVGVDIFFVVSGCLITQSMARGGDLGYFAASRVLRIYPGLVVALLVSVFAIGAFATTLPLHAYLGDRSTWSYVTAGAALHALQWTLPGVFESAPQKGIVNGSLWSLWPEMQMYLVVAVLGAASLVLRAPRRVVLVVGMAVVVAVALARHPDPAGLVLEGSSLARLAALFGLGALIGLARWRTGALPALLVAAIVALALARGTVLFVAAFDVALALGVLWFAYARIPWLPRFGRYGDWSYGIYVYAFPVQQLVHDRWPGLSIGWHFVVAYPAIVLLGALSWHVVEAPALAFKRRLRRGRRPATLVAQPRG